MGIQTAAGSRHSRPADQRHAPRPPTIAAVVRRLAQHGAAVRNRSLPGPDSRGLLFEGPPQLVDKWWHLFPRDAPPDTRRLPLGKGLRAFTDGLVPIVLPASRLRLVNMACGVGLA